ncbi:NAD(P)H nitroreductase [Devosia riboflavina]|uniref:Putative NAD(P)H nitroreductase n=1 Tax=Devosia riboflavina TaxID=46914 RepID=A0A087M1S5_9HYPH|nr:nitroreductase [Devosia riboflavina]KFL30828.1 NAD(P)H nitroreductase [Devosia riboflavina]
MPVNPALRDHLLTRRSVGQAFLAEPAPTGDDLQTLLTIATRVPDHGKLAPWRLVLFSGDARAAAGEKLAEIAKRKRPELDEAGLDIERRQFLPAPLVIGIISTAKPHVKIPEFEQLLSAGNVAFNLVHGAYALGYAATWITRWYTFDTEAAAMLGAKEGERFVGFVHIGTPTTTIEDRPRPDLAEIVTEWRP